MRNKQSRDSSIVTKGSGLPLRPLSAALLLGLIGTAHAQSGSPIKQLYDFPVPNSPLPHGDLVQGAEGNLYGTTVYGGDSGTGMIYRLSPVGTFTVLYNFVATDQSGANAGGAYPQAGVVVGPDGNLYGTTVYGGSNGNGTVFRLTGQAGSNPTHHVIYEFGATDGNGFNQDGAQPYAGLVAGADGNLYGVSTEGGTAGHGTIFRIDLNGRLTTVHEFAPYQTGLINADGAHPTFRLTPGPDGNLYGAAGNGGGHGWGAIFRISPGGDFRTLYSFDQVEKQGQTPIGLAFGPDGALYGTTQLGLESGINLPGSIFRYSEAKGLETLYLFHDYAGEGAAPERSALVPGADGAWYGVSFGGDGAGGADGVLYRFVPGVSYESVYVLGSNAGDLLAAQTTLLPDGHGNFLGTASLGEAGTNSAAGGIFRIPVDQVGPVSLSVSPATITAGSSATLTWNAGNFDNCFAERDWRDARPDQGTTTVSPGQPGTYYYELSCKNQSTRGQGAKTVMLTVLPASGGSSGGSSGGTTGGASGGGSFDLPCMFVLGLGTLRRRIRHVVARGGQVD